MTDCANEAEHRFLEREEIQSKKSKLMRNATQISQQTSENVHLKLNNAMNILKRGSVFESPFMKLPARVRQSEMVLTEKNP